MFKKLSTDIREEFLSQLKKGEAISLELLHLNILSQVYDVDLIGFDDPTSNTKDSHEKTLQYILPLIKGDKLAMYLAVLADEEKDGEVGLDILRYEYYDFSNIEEGIEKLRYTWNSTKDLTGLEMFTYFILPEFKNIHCHDYREDVPECYMHYETHKEEIDKIFEKVKNKYLS